MEKKSPKRKLIGFMAGEKGSIGKLQALALGIAGVIGSSLIPTEVDAGSWINYQYGIYYTDWYDAGWDNAYDVAWTYTPYWGYWTDAPWDWPNWGDWGGNWVNSPPSVEVEVK